MAVHEKKIGTGFLMPVTLAQPTLDNGTNDEENHLDVSNCVNPWIDWVRRTKTG